MINLVLNAFIVLYGHGGITILEATRYCRYYGGGRLATRYFLFAVLISLFATSMLQARLRRFRATKYFVLADRRKIAKCERTSQNFDFVFAVIQVWTIAARKGCGAGRTVHHWPTQPGPWRMRSERSCTSQTGPRWRTAVSSPSTAYTPPVAGRTYRVPSTRSDSTSAN